MAPFWKTKKLHEMSASEWESLCDRCGRCCLNKLEDWDTGDIHYTNIACSELDCKTCQCKSYSFRFDVVQDCIDLTPQKVAEIDWLPPTCAYRLVKEGRDLRSWHPLISGNSDSVHLAGISVRGRVIPETGLGPDDYENHMVSWPEEDEKQHAEYVGKNK